MATKDQILATIRQAPAAPKRTAASQPSAEVQAMVARLGRGRDLKTPARWPNGDLEFDLWVLTQSERDEAEATAVAALKARGYDVGSSSPLVGEAILVAKAVAMLAVAMRDRSTGEPVFASPQMLAEVATEDEIDQLVAMYAEHRASNDPALRSLSEAEVAEIEAAVKKRISSV